MKYKHCGAAWVEVTKAQALALNYILRKKLVKEIDIEVGRGHVSVLAVKDKIYIPHMYVPKRKLAIYALPLGTFFDKYEDMRDKVYSYKASKYRVIVMVFQEGRRIALPKDWHRLGIAKCKNRVYKHDRLVSESQRAKKVDRTSQA